MPRPWRLLLHDPADGAWNMGVDEALLASASEGAAPALRLYQWHGPCLSLGYAQPVSAQRLSACADAGVAIVRRVTGGRAVLHGSDLSYAVAAPTGCLPAGIRETYRCLTEALRAALRELGLEASPARGGGRQPARPHFDCFAEVAPEELTAAGSKLVGSAQRRLSGAVLQHGSIRLRPDPEAVRRATGTGMAGAVSLSELGVERSVASVREALVRAFAAALDAAFEPVRLTPCEARRAEFRQKLHIAEPLVTPIRIP